MHIHSAFNRQLIQPFADFPTAVQAVLEYLQQQLGFQLWMFTRVEGNDWLVLSANDQGYGVQAGDVFQWSDSFCYRMVTGDGPNIAPCSQQVPAYAEAPIGEQVPINAYIGIPIYLDENHLFGTLCAIDPQTKPETVTQHLPLLLLATQLLTTILVHDLKAQENARRCERAEAEAQLDSLTGLYNRRGWERLIEGEENRCKVFGVSASILIIDLDNLKITNDRHGHLIGDLLLQQTAKILQEKTRSQDVVARLGGDEFGILLVEANQDIAQKLSDRIQQALEAANILASIGWSTRSPDSTLLATLERADKQMYSQKAARKQHISADQPFP